MKYLPFKHVCHSRLILAVVIGGVIAAAVPCAHAEALSCDAINGAGSLSVTLDQAKATSDKLDQMIDRSRAAAHASGVALLRASGADAASRDSSMLPALVLFSDRQIFKEVTRNCSANPSGTVTDVSLQKLWSNALIKMARATQSAQASPSATAPNSPVLTTPNAHTLLNTLDKLMADQKQEDAPSRRYNQAQSDMATSEAAPKGGGVPNGDITRRLTFGQQRAIGNEVKRCYSEDTTAERYAQYTAHITVTVDAGGVARVATFSPGDLGRMSADPAFRAFAERARDAVLSPTCASLPLPRTYLGGAHQISFPFSP